MGEPVTLKTALDSIRAQLALMDDANLTPAAGLDATDAATKVLGNLERILRYRPAIDQQFGAAGTAFVDSLEVAALATQQADIEYAAAERAANVSAMQEALGRQHKRLIADATPLADRGLLDPIGLEKARSTQGYDTTIKNTLVLVTLFRDAWPAIEQKTLMTLDELTSIEKHAQAVGMVTGQRTAGTSSLSAATIRIRALSELVRRYGETRRMLSYIRWWEDDVDDIAPSLWAGRARKSNRGPTETGGNEPPEPVPTPGPTDGGGPFQP